MVSISQLLEIPTESMIFMVGPPGAGKSTFCEQTILHSLTLNKPIIYVTTEYGPSKAETSLIERGLGELEPESLNFIDAFTQTVGMSVFERSDTVWADCANLSSIGIAISKLQQRIARKGVLMVFDSLTSPYLLSGQEIVRFMRLTLSRFAAEGNSVLACFDEGSGKSEDVVAMMSLSNGVIKIEREENKQLFTILKHPKLESTKIEVTSDKIWERKIFDAKLWDESIQKVFMAALSNRMIETQKLTELFDTNIFWPNFAFWSVMLWDPKRFPRITYEAWKEFGAMGAEMISMFPWHKKLLLRLFMPKSFSKVKNAKKMLRFMQSIQKVRRDCIFEYLEDVSQTDEHHIRVYDSRECCGLENLGTTMAFIWPALLASNFVGLEHWRGLERDWNAIETKCIGLGDPYCEWKIVPGKIEELRGSLEKDVSVVEKIHEHLMDRLMRFMLDGKPLVDRPRLGNYFAMGHPEITLPAVAGERYRMALRMGGVRAGKKVGERLMDVGKGVDEAMKCLLNFLEQCKVGEIRIDETIIIKGNRESAWTKVFTMKRDEPSCFFTTGFLNGFFYTIKNQHIKETKCIAMGDPYCEWEFI